MRADITPQDPTKHTWADIYLLLDPFTKEVRYVGKSHDANARFFGHLNDVKTSKNSHAQSEFCRWFDGLIEAGSMPVLEIIGRVPYDKAIAIERVTIKQWRDSGARLFNREMPRSLSNVRISSRLVEHLDEIALINGFSTGEMLEHAISKYIEDFMFLLLNNKKSLDV